MHMLLQYEIIKNFIEYWKLLYLSNAKAVENKQDKMGLLKQQKDTRSKIYHKPSVLLWDICKHSRTRSGFALFAYRMYFKIYM